jgi:DNA adenine methylase
MDNYVTQKVRPAFAYYGGKLTICRRILQISPPHTTYVEGYAGGLSVLLNKFRSDREVVCDINPEIINFYHVLVATPEKIIEKIQAIKFSKLAFSVARSAKDRGDELTRAVNFLVCQHMSFGGRGTAWAEKEDRKAGYWKTLPYDLEVASRRLQGVRILLRSAFEVIQEYDSPDTFFYLDPPYYEPTRVSLNGYTCEMSQIDHLRLLRLLRTLKGHVILSGYDHLTYNKELAGWDRVEIDIASFSSLLRSANGEGDKRGKRTEVLWVKPQGI